MSKSENTNAVGDIVNLMSVDCQRIQDSLFFSHYCVTFFLMLGGAIALLWNTLGKIYIH